MAWSDLANNQAISFTDIQTSGFILKTGESHVTSNQCMTRDDIVNKYYVNVTFTANNQLAVKALCLQTTYAYTFSAAFATAAEACGASTSRTRYSGDSPLVFESTIYTDAAKTLQLNGGNSWFKVAGYSTVFKINTTGLIVEIVSC
jgi:hypothetical protein